MQVMKFKSLVYFCHKLKYLRSSEWSIFYVCRPRL